MCVKEQICPCALQVVPAINGESCHGAVDYNKENENYAQCENQHEKNFMSENNLCPFLYRLIWEYCFPLSFALKVKRIRPVIKMFNGERSRIIQCEKICNICKKDHKLAMAWRQRGILLLL